MKLSLKIHDKTYSVESDEGYDGSTLEELTEQFKGLLTGAGFHPSNVDDMFNTEYQWFTQEERDENMQGHKRYNYTDPDHPMYLAQEEDHMEAYNQGYEAGLNEALRNKKIEEFQDNLYRSTESNKDD